MTSNKKMAYVFKKVREEERAKTIIFSVQAYSAAMTMVLYDKFDFTGDQLQKIATEINDIFDSILQGYVTIEEIQSTMKEEGIDISLTK